MTVYRFAYLISRVFDPILIVPLLMGVIFWHGQDGGYTWDFLVLLGAFELVLPGLVVVGAFMKRSMHDWDIHNRAARIPLFIAGSVSHLIGLFITWWYGYEELFGLLLGLWVLLVVYLAITYAYKISVHTGSVVVLAFLITMLISWHFWWVWIVPPLVGWSRLVVKQHSLGQVLMGIIVPTGVLYGVYWYVGLI